jgi:hypothetical protein
MLEHVDIKKLTKLIRTGRLAPLYPHELAQQDVAEVRQVQLAPCHALDCCPVR